MSQANQTSSTQPAPQLDPLHAEILGIMARRCETALPEYTTYSDLVAWVKRRELAVLSQAASGSVDAKYLLDNRTLHAAVSKLEDPRLCDQELAEAEAVDDFITNQLRLHYAEERFQAFDFSDDVKCMLYQAKHELFRLLGPGPTDDDWSKFDRATVYSKGTPLGLSADFPILRKWKKGSKKAAEDTETILVKDPSSYTKLGSAQVLGASRLCVREFGPLLFGGPYGLYLLKRMLLETGDAGSANGDEIHSVQVQEMDYAVLSAVYKDADTKRVIARQPPVNLMAQHGNSAMLVPYLRSWGINLSDQTKNQKLAKKASCLGFRMEGWATQDQSKASDSVMDVAVRFFFPEGWYSVLDCSRAHAVRVDSESESIVMPLFATMGDATTFVIETLIFAALTRAAMAFACSSNRTFAVYGDDIVVPVEAYAVLCELLEACGFLPNAKKSHIIGQFRESCGTDYYNGVDVRPPILRTPLTEQSGRHLYFNGLGRKRLFEEARIACIAKDGGPSKALIGPLTHPEEKAETHYEAPVFALRQHPRCTIMWNENVQAYQYGYRRLDTKSRRRARTELERKFLCSLVGEFDTSRHDVRGTTSTRVGWSVTTTPVVIIGTPLWYIPEEEWSGR